MAVGSEFFSMSYYKCVSLNKATGLPGGWLSLWSVLLLFGAGLVKENSTVLVTGSKIKWTCARQIYSVPFLLKKKVSLANNLKGPNISIRHGASPLLPTLKGLIVSRSQGGLIDFHVTMEPACLSSWIIFAGNLHSFFQQINTGNLWVDLVRLNASKEPVWLTRWRNKRCKNKVLG